MNFDIPDEIVSIYKKLEKSGFEAYLIGGCVRNLLLKKEVKDWDMATNATPEEMLKLFSNAFYDNLFGTVGIPLKKRRIADTPEHPGVVEATTYRTEHGYIDRRHPKKVSWGKSIEEDLSRRDFTINAIALQLNPKRYTLNPGIVDPFKGQDDIKKKIIKAVGDPKKRFKEDALRLIRAIRFATTLLFTIEENTWNEIVNDSRLIDEISKERIKDELLRILESDYPYEGIMLLKNSGLLEHILPELLDGIEVSQVRPGRHHKTDVFTHNVLSLKFCPSIDPIVRLAALLHDAGKPKVASKDEKGLIIFHNHEIAGAKIAHQICERLKFSKKDREKIVNLIR